MKTNSSIIVEVLRGNFLESRHKVDAVVCDERGAVYQIYGDENLPVYPRSANKALMGLLLVESGAADAFGFEPKHLALACSSHNGESFQTEAASHMLEVAGLDATCLECGAQLPYLPRDIESNARKGIATSAIHNNCSGKHSGFLATAVHLGMPTKDYVQYDHRLQREIAGILQAVTGARHGDDNYGIDGCSIPTFQIPLKNLASAYGKFSVGEDASKIRSNAMQRLRNACMEHPEMVAGTNRFDTDFMQAFKGRVFTKTGAEGVFTCSIPELGLGFALKCHDGTTRAAEVACAHLVESLLQQADSKLSEAEIKTLKRFTNPALKNWNGIEVGALRVASAD